MASYTHVISDTYLRNGSREQIRTETSAMSNGDTDFDKEIAGQTARIIGTGHAMAHSNYLKHEDTDALKNRSW